MQEQIVHRPITELNKLKNNPRQISGKQLKTLIDSLKKNPRYFNAHPIILSNRTGETVIIAGNQRYEAAKRAGYTTVPTVLLEGLTEDEEKEIIVRDNINNGEWDFDVLANEWDKDHLAEWGLELFPEIEEQEDVPISRDMKLDLEDKKKIYDEAFIKQIILYFSSEDYERAIIAAEKLFPVFETQNNSELYLRLLEQEVQKHLL